MRVFTLFLFTYASEFFGRGGPAGAGGRARPEAKAGASQPASQRDFCHVLVRLALWTVALWQSRAKARPGGRGPAGAGTAGGPEAGPGRPGRRPGQPGQPKEWAAPNLTGLRPMGSGSEVAGNNRPPPVILNFFGGKISVCDLEISSNEKTAAAL